MGKSIVNYFYCCDLRQNRDFKIKYKQRRYRIVIKLCVKSYRK